MTPKQIAGIIAILFIALVALASTFTIREGQQGLLLQLGKIVKDSKTGQAKIYEPGLHFKWPLIMTVKRFDTRIQNWTATPFNVLTSEQAYLDVDYFVKWRIVNLQSFYTRTGGDYKRADLLLEQKINGIVRREFGSHTGDDLISAERDKVMLGINGSANDVAKELGINVIQVRLKSIMLRKAVMESVFKRMASERMQIATNKRAEGEKQAEAIRALADKHVKVIEATAMLSSAKTRATGEQKAAEIFAKAYGSDVDFYSYYRSLQAYKQSFDKGSNVLVMQPNNQFFKYFNTATA